LRNVADQLLDHHRLTNAGAAEDTDLSTLLEWADKIDHLDAGFEEFRLCGEIVERWRRAVNWKSLVRLHITRLVNRITEHIEDATERSRANRDRDWRAKVGCLCAARKAVSSGHGDSADAIVAKVLLHLYNERPVCAINAYRVIDCG
jgi:peptide chain release factor 1